MLLAPFLSAGYTMHDPEALARANAYLASLVANHGERLIGFAVVNAGTATAWLGLANA